MTFLPPQRLLLGRACWLLVGGLMVFIHPAWTSAVARYARLPLAFEPNQGQMDRISYFTARGQGFVLLVKGSETVLMPEGSAVPALRMKLTGARKAAHTEGLDRLPGSVNYFRGRDPRRWRRGIPTYARVRCRGVYAGIDAVFYGNQRQFEQDFVVAAGANPAAIRMQFSGGSVPRIGADGDLTIQTSAGEFRLRKPVAYQETEQGRRAVEARFRLMAGSQAGFELGAYDRRRELVIDPVLAYSAILGGLGQEAGMAVAVDSAGNAYITGSTTSPDFPSTGAIPVPTVRPDVFVSKLNADGTALIYSTYVGGEKGEDASGIALDASGNAYVTGVTKSVGFPVVNPVQATLSGTEDWFAFKLNAAGDALVYSTYLPWSPSSNPRIAVETQNGSAIVAWMTASGASFVTPGAYAPTFTGNGVMVVKLSSAGGLVYSAYVGPVVAFNDVAVDTGGNAYIVGEADDRYLTTPGAYLTSSSAGGPVLSKLSADGSALVYSTFLSASSSDDPRAVAVDGNGSAYVAGSTMDPGLSGPGLPATPGAFQTARAGGWDGFVAKLDPAGASLVYSTYLGGGRADSINALAVDSSGAAYVAGSTTSDDFPVTANPLQGARTNPGGVLYQTADRGGTWTSAETGFPGTAFQSLSVHPSNRNDMLVVADQTIYRSTDGGAHWTRTYWGWKLGRSPSNPNVVYSTGSGRLLKSADSGASWTLITAIGNPQPPAFANLVVDPTNDAVVYCWGSSSGTLLRTENSGLYWFNISTPSRYGAVTSFAINPTNSNVLYLSGQYYGVHKSVDRGATWFQTLLSDPQIRIAGVALAPSHPATLYAWATGSSVLYKSTNGAASWAKLTAPSGDLTVIAVAPSDPDVVYAGTSRSGVFSSADGGQTWNAVGTGPAAQAIDISPADPASAIAAASPAKDSFVAKIAPSGASVDYATYLPPSINGIAVANGDAYITGRACTFLQTPGSYGRAACGGDDAFVARISEAPASCTYSVTADSTFLYESGGQVRMSVFAPGGCAWSVSELPGWISLRGAAAGSGLGAVNLLVSRNTGAGRSATLTIGGQSVTISQAGGGCTYALSNTPVTLPAAGGAADVTITAAAGCDWNVASPAGWLAVANGAASGSGTITVSAQPNPALGWRWARVQIGNSTLEIAQPGSCTYSSPDSTSFAAFATRGQFTVTRSQSSCPIPYYSWSADWLLGVGIGEDLLLFSNLPNETGATRTASLTLAGNPVTITQYGTYSIYRDVNGSLSALPFPTGAAVSSGGYVEGEPAATQDQYGKIYAAARDHFGAIWLNTFDPGANAWQGWVYLGAQMQGVPSIAACGQNVYVTARDLWNSYWVGAYNSGSGFAGWNYLAGVFSTDPVTSCNSDTVWIVGKDTWNSIWTAEYSTTWFGLWHFIGGIVKGKSSVTEGPTGQAFIAVRDFWDSVWMARADGANFAWYYGGGIISGDPQIAGNATTAFVAIRDPWGVLWYRPFVMDLGNNWMDWVNTGGVLEGFGAGAVGNALFIAGATSGNDLWWYRSTGNSWNWVGDRGVSGSLLVVPR